MVGGPHISVAGLEFMKENKEADIAILGEGEMTTLEILNALKYGYTNGCTEGYNNKIKVLKRISYGVRNFKRFRNRILHIC